MSTTFKLETNIELPKPPNFLRTSEGVNIPVEKLSDEELQKLGQAMAENLIKHAQSRREERGKRIAQA